jgi:hypothetical protein
MTREINASWSGSIRSRKMPDGEFNLTVGKLPPPFDDRRETVMRCAIDNLAGFAASRI